MPANTVNVPGAVTHAQLHSLPIKVSATATVTALTDSFVKPVQAEKDVQQAHFRGRLLRGCAVDLPMGYTGLVVRPGGSNGSDACGQAWTAQSAFQQFHAWNHDAAPSKTDPARRALDLLTLATQVHAPISLEDVEAELSMHQQP